MLMYVSIYLIDILNIFIQYQKLNNIAIKYSFIIQEYGYLTNKEEEELYNDLMKNSFKLSNLNVSIPKERKNYGELITFSIEYKTYLNKFIFNKEYNQDKIIILKVNKSFYKNK